MSLLGRAARALAAIGIGKVTYAEDDAGPVQRMQVDFGRHLGLRNSLPFLANFGFTSRPPSGTDVLAFFPDGDSTNAIVIASGNKALRLKNLAEGDAAIYDARGAYVWLTPDGVHVHAQGKPVLIEAATIVTVTASERIKLKAPRIDLNPAD